MPHFKHFSLTKFDDLSKQLAVGLADTTKGLQRLMVGIQINQFSLTAAKIRLTVSMRSTRSLGVFKNTLCQSMKE